MDSRNAPQQIYSIHYILKDDTGEVLESSHGDEPMTFLSGVGQIIPGLESKVSLMAVGDKGSFKIAAVDAYGEFDEELIVEVPRDKFPKKDVQVGDQFQADDGQGHGQMVVVTEVSDTSVTVDGNHPLAGEDLSFDIELISVRPATQEEIAHGHAHGPGGIHH